MNAPFQDGLLQSGEQEDGIAESMNPQAESMKDQSAGAGVQTRAAATPMNKNEPVTEERNALGYRTRWLAWAIIGAGWIGCAAAILLRGGAVEWFMAAVLTMVMAVSGLAPALAAAGFSAARVLSQELTREGGQLVISLTLKRSLLIPIVWIAVHDETMNESSAANRKISIRTVFTPALRKETTYRYTLHKLRRGRHPFEHVTVTVGDWLGLTAIRKRVECKSEFIVLPGIPQPENGTKTERAGGAAIYAVPSPLTGEALDRRGEAGREEIEAAVRAAGMGPHSRPYREGDSLRHLDWRSAAKGRGLHTKVYTPEQPVQTFIAVDTLASAYDKDDRLFDACVGWAALAVTKAAWLGSGVTLLLGQGGQAIQLPADDRTEDGISGMLHAMALLRAEGKGSLAGSFVRGSKMLTRGCTILVFSADWRGGRSWGELAGYAAEHGCRLELFIVTRSNIPSFAMREQQKWLESGGVKLTWLHVPAGMAALPYAEEGGEAHEFA